MVFPTTLLGNNNNNNNNNTNNDKDIDDDSCEGMEEAFNEFLNGPTVVVGAEGGGGSGGSNDPYFGDEETFGLSDNNNMMMMNHPSPDMMMNMTGLTVPQYQQQQQQQQLQQQQQQQQYAGGASSSSTLGWFGRPRQVSDSAVSSEQDTVMGVVTATDQTMGQVDEEEEDFDDLHTHDDDHTNNNNNNNVGSVETMITSTTPTTATTPTTSSTDNDPPVPVPTMTGRFPVVLYLSCNVDYLSPYQCLIRKQIQFFEANHSDISASIKGRNKPIVLGQVGIQCIHCAYLVSQPQDRSKGAMYYPHTLKGIYQAAQILCTTHLLETCTHIPTPIKDELKALRSQKSSSQNTAGKEYWAQTASVLGVYEDTYGLRFTPTFPGIVQHHD